MNAIDTTIANVALPHIQGSVSASADEISWVLTSYIVAAAICMPLTGWFAARFGRRRLMMGSIVGFTIASALCGLATTLDEIVGFRLLQGIFGAALVPMSQAILLDINPPEKHGSAMSVWSMGTVLAPIVGPTLGGWLTDNLSWRWVFYINVPIGAIAFVGLSLFLRNRVGARPPRFDFFGFGTLALAIGAFQLMLDRGQTQDWFNSTEICIEATTAGFFFYLFVVHTLTARHPFVNPAIFRDRNFVLGSAMGFLMGTVLFGMLALLPPMLETLFGYPVVFTGIVTAPRGIGSLIAMSMSGWLLRRIDPRVVMTVGLVCLAGSMYAMTEFDLNMGWWEIVTTGLVQGFGSGLVFVPLTLIAFGTLDPIYRNEGAAMFMLIRNLGAAVGIASLQALITHNSAVVHSRLIEAIRPDNPVMALRVPDFDFNLPATVAALNAQISRQATMVAYIDDFWLLFVLGVVTLPAVLLIRRPRSRAKDDDLQIHVE